jgi:hypothetical protein
MEIVNYNGNYTYKSEEKGIYRSKTNFAGSFSTNCFGLQAKVLQAPENSHAYPVIDTFLYCETIDHIKNFH